MIDKTLQSELRKKYNPDGSDLRKMQLRLLEMLKFIDKICIENNIPYWLSSGTCLGAVRHEGFIPWDDDIDIELMDKDYEKLIQILEKSETEEFVVQTKENDPNYIYPFGKLRDKTTHINEKHGLDKFYKYQGFYIDIFKMEDSNSKIIHYWCGRLRVLEFYFHRWSLNKNKFMQFLSRSLIKFNDIVISLIRPLHKFNSKGRIRHVLGGVAPRPRFKQDIFPLTRTSFEGILLPIPKNAHAYLTKMFGDYTELKISHTHLHQKNNN